MKNKLTELKKKSRILLIHHWDCDGICSAALLFDYFNKLNKNIQIKFFTPTINNYSLKDEDFNRIKETEFDMIISVDFALAKKDILKLKNELDVPLIFFDHHSAERIEEINYINPALEQSPDLFPCCTWVITKYLGIEPEFLSILGAVGDKEERIKENKEFFPKIKKIMQEYDLDFDDLMRIVNLIDSNYILGDLKAIDESIKFVLDNKNNPKNILDNKQFISAFKKVESEIDKYVNYNPKFEKDNISLYKIDLKYNILSKVTRQLSRKFPNKMIIVCGDLDNLTHIYVRRKNIDFDMKQIINFAKNKGFEAGGKPEVAGIIVPKDKSEEFINEIIHLLSNG